jgi:hypothetical protein
MTLVGALFAAFIAYVVVDMNWPGWGSWAAIAIGVLAVLGWVGQLGEWWQRHRPQTATAPQQGDVPHIEIRVTSDATPRSSEAPLPVPRHIALPKVRRPSPIRTNKGPYLAHDITVDVLLKYRDGVGEVTERLATVRQLTGTLHRDGSITLESMIAYCHLRKDARTFMFSRVVSAADPETGEVIDDVPTWVARRSGRMEPVRGVTPDWMA